MNPLAERRYCIYVKTSTREGGVLLLIYYVNWDPGFDLKKQRKTERDWDRQAQRDKERDR